MLNKFKKNKSNFSLKKIGLLLGALLLTIGLGSGMNNAFAGQDAGSSLINWFGAKRTASEQDISGAITAEKNRLMDELKISMQQVKLEAEEELAAFTEKEKQERTKALQEYAAELKANMEINLTEEKQAIIAELDAKLKQDIENLEKNTTPIETTPEANPGAEVKPETAPNPEAEVQPNPTPETENEPKPEPVPEPATQPETGPETTPKSESAQ